MGHFFKKLEKIQPIPEISNDSVMGKHLLVIVESFEAKILGI